MGNINYEDVYVELLLEVWCQWGSYSDSEGQVRYSDMGLSTLEYVKEELDRRGLLHSDGTPNIYGVNRPEE